MNDINQKAKELGVPVIHPFQEKEQISNPNDINKTIALCGKCGLELKSTMHYSCNRQYCPCFPTSTLMMDNSEKRPPSNIYSFNPKSA